MITFCQQCRLEGYEGKPYYASADKLKWVCRACFRRQDLEYANKVGAAESFLKQEKQKLKENAKRKEERTMQVEDVQEAWEATDVVNNFNGQ